MRCASQQRGQGPLRVAARGLDLADQDPQPDVGRGERQRLVEALQRAGRVALLPLQAAEELQCAQVPRLDGEERLQVDACLLEVPQREVRRAGEQLDLVANRPRATRRYRPSPA